jgi:hypothetical protein
MIFPFVTFVSFCSKIRVLRRRFLFTAVAVLAAAIGCSSSNSSAVEGKVTYGGQPIDVGTITFIPQSKEAIKRGGLIQNGAYSVEAEVGPAPGPHRVEIRWARPTGKSSKNEYGENIQVRQEGLPEKYHAQSTLTADIKPGKNTIDFALEK